MKQAIKNKLCCSLFGLAVQIGVTTVILSSAFAADSCEPLLPDNYEIPMNLSTPSNGAWSKGHTSYPACGYAHNGGAARGGTPNVGPDGAMPARYFSGGDPLNWKCRVQCSCRLVRTQLAPLRCTPGCKATNLIGTQCASRINFSYIPVEEGYGSVDYISVYKEYRKSSAGGAFTYSMAMNDCKDTTSGSHWNTDCNDTCDAIPMDNIVMRGYSVRFFNYDGGFGSPNYDCAPKSSSSSSSF